MLFRSGFIEDLRAFGLRTYPTSIQTPMNYFDEFTYNVGVTGASGNAFTFVGSTGIGVTGFNPTLILQRGKSYNFNLTTLGYNFYLTTDPLYSQADPLGVINNGASGGTGGAVTINVSPQEQNTIYYYSDVNSYLREIGRAHV